MGRRSRPRETASTARRITPASLAKPLPPYEDVAGEPLAKVESRAAKVEAELSKYRQDLAEMEAAPKCRSQRMAELPKQSPMSSRSSSKSTDELTALGSEDMADVAMARPPRHADAIRGGLPGDARTHCDREQRLYEQSGEWVKIRRDYFARYVPHKEKRLAQLRAAHQPRREDAAQQQARLAAAEPSSK